MVLAIDIHHNNGTAGYVRKYVWESIESGRRGAGCADDALEGKL
jgi:hypothetical protein